MLPAPLLAELAAYLDEETDEAALTRICVQAAGIPLDIAELLAWLQQYRCEPARRQRALRAMRAALNLAVIPGPACRN